MKIFLISFITILVSMFVIDAFWLGTMNKRFYAPNIGHLLATSFKLAPAVFFYLLYGFALNIFVVGPELKSATSYLHVFAFGILFGLVTYGTYDLTNHATLKDWPAIVTIVDLAWGSFLTGIVSVISVYITRLFL